MRSLAPRTGRCLVSRAGALACYRPPAWPSAAGFRQARLRNGLLDASQWADFKFIRDSAGLSDSALSRQLAILEQARYVEIRKGFVGKRPRTSARLTPAGRTAFEQHVALQDMVAKAGVKITPQ